MSQEKSIAHVIFYQLRSKAKANNEDFPLLLARYGMERLLYRLSISSHSERFILKGASMFLVWKGQSYRVTKDADFLGLGNPDIEQLADTFRNICSIEFPDDGMVYLPETLKAEKISEAREYEGVQIKLIGLLNEARITLQIDVGFGDIITPAPESVEYPTLLNAPPPLLKAYTQYTLIAEKFEAMVDLGLTNSRMKDFYDIWLLSKLFPFKGDVLQKALKNTFKRRGTAFQKSMPLTFTSDFYDNSQKLTQWKAFVNKAKLKVSAGNLASVITEISAFLTPVIQPDEVFDGVWLCESGRWSK
ncbi:MAG: nucleotidyl transferase AbiEii/AbiGii toxin family protein [Fibromonadales bacterium]|nr:nucleotidyl transferase AbiEii/AbiGii toxin family protein [Fibromonadales bacterium]